MCTPVGFARMFSVVGDLVMRPQIRRELDEELKVARLEELSLMRKINGSLSALPIPLE